MASLLNPIRLMLLDDHELILQGIAQLIAAEGDMQVLGSFTKSRQLVDALQKQPVDVVVMDYSLSPGEVDGLNLIRGLRLRFPTVRLLVVSGTHTPATVSLAMRCGASGFLGKNTASGEIVVAIRRVAKGQQYLHPNMVAELNRSEVSIDSSAGDVLVGTRELDGLIRSSTLTIREREVLRCCLDGMTVSKIAEKFSRSVKTISTQKHSAFKKLGVTSDNELFRIREQFERG